MRAYIFTVLGFLGASALAQNLAGLPQCAQACVGTSLGGCDTLNITCICSNTNLISDLSCCVSTSCNPTDQNSTIQFAVNICKIANVAVPTAASCAAGASSTTGSSTNSATPVAVSSLSSILSSMSMTATAAASSAAGSASGSAASAAASATGAAGRVAVGMVEGAGVLAGVMGVLAAL